MNKKPKKLNKAQERRLKELDNLQRSLEANAELEREGVRSEAEGYRRDQMRLITDKVAPIETEYKKERKQAEQEKNRAINAANSAFSEAEATARAKKRIALASIEKEIDNLNQDVERRVAEGDAKVDKTFNEKLLGIVQERQVIRGGDEPKATKPPDAAAPAETEKPDEKVANAS